MAIIVLLLGIVGLGIGGAFVGVGWAKNNQITTYLKPSRLRWDFRLPISQRGKWWIIFRKPKLRL